MKEVNMEYGKGEQDANPFKNLKKAQKIFEEKGKMWLL